MSRNIGQVARVHAHAIPHCTAVDRAADAERTRIAQKIARRRLGEVVVVALFLQRRKDVFGICVAPVRQQDDVIAIGAMRVAVARLDDDGAVQASLLLKARVAVVPVSARLVCAEAIRIGRSRRNAHEAQARHSVHVGRQHDAVPVNRTRRR
jgi:hypothetical protein